MASTKTARTCDGCHTRSRYRDYRYCAHCLTSVRRKLRREHPLPDDVKYSERLEAGNSLLGQAGDDPGERAVRVRNPATGECGYLTADEIEQHGVHRA